MKSTHLHRIIARVAVIAAFVLPAGAANAFVDYVSFFDPPDFEGTSTFRIAKSCLAGGDGYRFSTSQGCSSNFGWTGATVTLKDPNSQTEQSNTFNIPFLGQIEYIYVEGGHLAGVNSQKTQPVVISSPNSNFNGAWTIEFNFPPPPITVTMDGGNTLAPATHLSFGTVSLCDSLSEAGCSEATVFGFTPQSVPEPGTLGLAFGALGIMGWFVRGRRAA